MTRFIASIFCYCSSLQRYRVIEKLEEKEAKYAATARTGAKPFASTPGKRQYLQNTENLPGCVNVTEWERGVVVYDARGERRTDTVRCGGCGQVIILKGTDAQEAIDAHKRGMFFDEKQQTPNPKQRRRSSDPIIPPQERDVGN